MPFAFSFALLTSIGRIDLLAVCGFGGEYVGLGDWLPPENDVVDPSAIGDDVFQPKKEVSLLGPGDRGVLVMTEGSWMSSGSEELLRLIFVGLEG